MSYLKEKIHKIIEFLIYKSDYKQDIKSFNIKTRGGTVTIINSPTGNCQLFCIKKFNRLLYIDDNKFKSIIKKCIHFTNKKLLLLDINWYYVNETLERLEYTFDVVSNIKYESSNGSIMHILILKYNPYKTILYKKNDKKLKKKSR